MPRMSFKDGVWTSDTNVQVKKDFVCQKGTSTTVTFDFPVNLTVNGSLNFNAQCSCCAEPFVLPTGKHSVNEAGELVSVYG